MVDIKQLAYNHFNLMKEQAKLAISRLECLIVIANSRMAGIADKLDETRPHLIGLRDLWKFIIRLTKYYQHTSYQQLEILTNLLPSIKDIKLETIPEQHIINLIDRMIEEYDRKNKDNFIELCGEVYQIGSKIRLCVGPRFYSDGKYANLTIKATKSIIEAHTAACQEFEKQCILGDKVADYFSESCDPYDPTMKSMIDCLEILLK